MLKPPFSTEILIFVRETLGLSWLVITNTAAYSCSSILPTQQLAARSLSKLMMTENCKSCSSQMLQYLYVHSFTQGLWCFGIVANHSESVTDIRWLWSKQFKFGCPLKANPKDFKYYIVRILHVEVNKTWLSIIYGGLDTLHPITAWVAMSQLWFEDGDCSQ